MLTAANVAQLFCFLGAWLLVAGPMFQGALELRAENFNRETLRTVAKSIGVVHRVSPWWWLLPPVLVVLQWRNTSRYRREMFAAMTTEQREKSVRYMNKARGWFMVAGGGVLLATAETWFLIKLLGAPPWSFWVLTVVMLVGCMTNTAANLARADRLVDPDARRAKIRTRQAL